MVLGVVDIGIGNLGSLKAALKKLNIQFKTCGTSSDFESVDKIILPGVGNFKKFMSTLKYNKIDKIILEKVKKNIPLLGICLGFQILFESSGEDGKTLGLNILRGNFGHFNEISKQIKVPHTGWNECSIKKKNNLFNNILDNSDFYFSHKYYLKDFDEKIVATKTNYHIDFVSSIKSNNICGVQFHPEKSQLNGLNLLKNFIYGN